MEPGGADERGSAAGVASLGIERVLDAVPTPVAVFVGPDHHVALLNAAYRRLCGEHAREHAGFADLLAAAHGDELFGIVRRVFETQRGLTLSGVAVSPPPDGIPTAVDLTFVPVAGDGERPAVVVVHGAVPTRTLARSAELRAQGQELVASRAEAAREHDLVLMLQDTVLPRVLPAIAGHQLAARYLAASDEIGIGGDWYDVVPLPDGRVAVCVGDVAGHGFEAVHVMGQLRSAGRVAAFLNPDPSAVMTAKDALMLHADLGPFATALFGVYDPTTGSFTWACAGHVPPAVVAGGVASFAPAPTGLPLGVGGDGYGTATLSLAPGDSLVLYTDGLVERRKESIDEGLGRLLEAIPADGASAADACDEVLERLGVVDGRNDDVCVLVLTRDR